MSAYIGVLGALFPLPVSGLSVERPGGKSYRTTLGGRRVAQVGLGKSRTWSASIGAATSDELTDLAGLSAGEFGDGPFVWVDPWAQVSNVITPAGSMLQIGHPPSGVSVGGAVTLAPGAVAGRHLTIEDTVSLPRMQGEVTPVPVRPGEPVTGSVWIRGQGVLELVFLDSDMEEVQSISSEATDFGQWARVSVSGDPGSAAAAVLRVSTIEDDEDVEVARPAVTWTDRVMPYHLGSGASSVVLDGLDMAVIIAAKHQGSQLAGASFQVVEVGE